MRIKRIRTRLRLEKSVDQKHRRQNGAQSEKMASLAGVRKKSHGQAGKNRTSTYRIWDAMNQRCRNPKKAGYKWYGGRGIRVSKRWHKFVNFLNDMGERPENLQLERMNNDGHYTKSNCKWASKLEQMNNTKRNHWVTFRGVKRTIENWARKLEINRITLTARFNRGWSIKRALTT